MSGTGVKDAPAPDMHGEPVHPERIGAGELYRAHASFVAGVLARMGTLTAELPDLVQEVFLTAHRRGGFVPGAAQPRTWLVEIAVNVLRNARRTRRRRPLDGGEPDLEAASGPDPERNVQALEALRAVHECLETLDEDHRATFVLFELEGLTAIEVAAALGVPAGTVYSRLHHARKRFLAAWSSRSQR